MTQFIANIIGLETEKIKESFAKKFEGNQKIIDMNFKAIDAANEHKLDLKLNLEFKKNKKLLTSAIMSGNNALSLGAVSAGGRAFYFYSMTPSSSILTKLPPKKKETGSMVKKAQ